MCHGTFHVSFSWIVSPAGAAFLGKLGVYPLTLTKNNGDRMKLVEQSVAKKIRYARALPNTISAKIESFQDFFEPTHAMGFFSSFHSEMRIGYCLG